MTRTLLIVFASIGIAPAVLLALLNLVVAVVSEFTRKGTHRYMVVSSFELPTNCCCLILIGAFILCLGLAGVGRPDGRHNVMQRWDSSRRLNDDGAEK